MPTTTVGPFLTITDVKRANAALGHHWFEPATMRFFRSRIESRLIGGRYFVSSEQFVPFGGEPDERLFSVRRADDDGSVETGGEFQQYATIEEALAAARGFAASDERTDA